MLKRGKFLLVLVILFATILSVEALESSATTTARVNVLPIYNLSVHINILNKLVFPNQNLFVVVDLRKFDLTKVKTSKRINVDLNYEIIQGNKIVKRGFIEKVPIIKYNRETVHVKIPSDFTSGFYDLRIIATSPQAYSASDKDGFLVLKKFWHSY
jgi:hypothetical protein